MKMSTMYILNKDDHEAIYRVTLILEAIKNSEMNIEMNCEPQDIIDSLSEITHQVNQTFERTVI